jgi:hypothetical protein
MTKGFIEIMNQIGKEISPDQIFIHFDRNLYYPADTIWFQAYIRDSRTGVFTTGSFSFYALLLNSQHLTIDSARFRIENATVSGWLKVPEETKAGDYSFLAFTSIDMNYKPEYAFSVPLRISRMISNYQKPENMNIEFSHTPLSKQVDIPDVDLRFLPEGGTFITGIKQRLAFNAVNSTGKILKIIGSIINQQNEKITEFYSSDVGPGIVEFTPMKGEKYFATLEGSEFRGIKWSLPTPEISGVCLRVEDAGKEFKDIIIHGKNTGNRLYFLTLTMNNVLVMSENFIPDSIYRKRIQTDKLPSGTAYLTVYDSVMNPIAERLIFLNSYKKMKINIHITPTLTFPGDETELTINTSDYTGNDVKSVISVSVVDSLTGFYNGMALPDIESSYLYDHIFYENLPVTLKAQGLGTIDNKSFDILLMTFGWRSFHPKEIVVDSINKPIEDFDLIKIENLGNSKNLRSEIKLMVDVNPNIITLPINKAGETELYYYFIDPRASQIIILPDNNPYKNKNPVKVTFPNNKKYIEEAKYLASYRSIRSYHSPIINEKQVEQTIADYFPIDTVEIKAPIQALKEKIYIDKNARMYQSSSTTTLYRKDFGSAFTFEDLLYRNIMCKVQGSMVFLRQTTPYISGTTSDPTWGTKANLIYYPALIVVDNTPLGTSFETIATMSVSHIASVTFLRSLTGVTMYGVKARGGIVFLTTSIGSGFSDEVLDQADKVNQDNDLLKQIRIFRSEAEFYIPTKEEISSNPENFLRTTLLWKTEIVTDGSNPIKLKFPNNKSKGSVIVCVNGVSFTNCVGSAKMIYKVRLP